MMKFNFVIVLVVLFGLKVSSQNDFIELPERVYISTLSEDKTTLAVASKKSVYIINVASLTLINTVDVITDRKSTSTINQIEFRNADNHLFVKVFELKNFEQRYENEDYLKDKNYIYNLADNSVIETYSGLELKSGNVSVFNELKKDIIYGESDNSYIELKEGLALYINDTLLDQKRYDEWSYFMSLMDRSEHATLKNTEGILKRVSGRIRHLETTSDNKKIAVVYFDSIANNNNHYKLEIRDAATLELLAEKSHITDRLISEIDFIENNKYVILKEEKISQDYYKKQSKTSIYYENFRPDFKLTFLSTDDLAVPDTIEDTTQDEFTLDNDSYWVIENDDIVNYQYGTNKVLTYVGTLEFEFHRTRGFYKINDDQALIIGSNRDEQDKDYITKNGVLKYSLIDSKLYNKIADVKEQDTLYNVATPFLQNNDFTGSKLQFSGDDSVFLASLNSEEKFQLWSVKARKKLHDIDLKLGSRAYLDQRGNSVLIFSRPDNLDNGFLLRKLDVTTGILTSRENTISDNKNPMSAFFYHNYKESKWLGVNRNIIWEVDTETMTYTKVFEEDFNSGYVFDYQLLHGDETKIVFKGTAYNDVTEILVEGVWIYDIEAKKLTKLEAFTDRKNVFKFGDKLLSYDAQSYYIHNLETTEIEQQFSINSSYIYNIINKNNKSYVLVGDGKDHSQDLKVLEYDNDTNLKLHEFDLRVNYNDYAEFKEFFAIEEGLVYNDNENNLQLYSPTLQYTSKWKRATRTKHIGKINVGKEGNLLIDGIYDLNLKSLELSEIELDYRIHDAAQFFLSPLDDNQQLLFLRSYGHSDNNGKAYIQCKLVKNNATKDPIWVSNKINDKDIIDFSNVLISKDKKFAILFKDAYLNHYYVVDIERQTLIKRKLPYKDRFIGDYCFVMGAKTLYLYDPGASSKLESKSKTYVYEIASGKLITTLKEIQITDELPDGRLLYTDWENGYGEFYLGRLSGQTLIEDFNYNTYSIGNRNFYDAPRKQIISTAKSQILFWKIDEKSPFKSIEFSGNISNSMVLEDKMYILFYDNNIKVLDLKTNTEKLNISLLERNNIIKPVFLTPEGYFKAAKENIRNYHFVKGKDAFSLLNYELYLNRPDVILERLGFAKKKVINVYKEAFVKRLKRNNLTEELDYFSLKRPSVELLNKKDITVVTKDQYLNLSLKKSEDIKVLDIYINGVPVFKDRSTELNVESAVELNSGLNKITVIGTDNNGIESDPITLEITNTAEVIPPNIYYLGIGVSKYKDASMNLRFADVDVRSISKLMNDKFLGRIAIDTLNNESATKSNILALKNKLTSTSINDVVIISFSGHGLVDDNKDFYFATHDVDFNNPAEKGLSYENIQYLLDDIPARKKILLIDACHSGELDSSDDNPETTAITSNVNSYLPEGAKGSKGSKVKSTTDGRDSFELMQTLFYDLDRGNGSFVISAAGGKEFAFESRDWGNGVFTYSFINAINELSRTGYPQDGKINISELKNYIYKSVSRLTNNQQKPTSRAENLEWDWVLE